MGMGKVALACVWALGATHVVRAATVDLFTQLTYSEADNSPPPEDSLAVYDSSLNVSGLAGMPTIVAVHISREGADDVVAALRLERMDRREGFGERDPQACDKGDLSGCEIVPYPDLSPEIFSYTWTGQGDGFDLRLTIHQGHAVGVLSGANVRYAISWNGTKELRLDYFRTDDSIAYGGDRAVAPPAAVEGPAPTMSEGLAQAATIARIEPQANARGAELSQLDMLVLVTEEARQEAGGNPADCRDVAGAMTYIHQNISSMNTAFDRSLIPAQIGAVTVTRLSGYAIIPYGDATTIIDNRNTIQASNNVRALRNAVGADIVATLLDKQSILGVCGVAFIQRSDCGGSAPGCSSGPQFSDWTYLLETVECSVVDTFTHELGHVLGAEHDPQHTNATPSTASFPYSFGYGYGSGVPDGFETIMSQRFHPQFPVRLLQFSNPNVLYGTLPTGIPGSAENARTLTNLSTGTAGFRSRPNVVFTSGFDETNACPGITL